MWLTRCVLSFIMVLIISSAQAESPRPYIGGGFSFTNISEDAHHPYHPSWGDCGTPYLGDDYLGPGLLMEGGLMGSFWDLHSVMNSESGNDHSAKWQSLRLGIGGRLRVPDSVKNPLKPFIGGGLQAGWARFSGGYTSAVSSKLSGGFYGEFGVMITTRSSLRPMIMLRYDRLDSRIDMPYWYIPGADYLGVFVILTGRL